MNYIQSNKFSDTNLIIRTLLPLDSSTITAYNVLIHMMKNKTEYFSTRQALVSALNNAYGMKVSFGLTSYGHQIAITMKVQYIRADWIEDENYIEDVKKIIDETLFHSILDEANFEEAKYLLKVRLERIMDDPDSLAVYESFQNVAMCHTINVPMQGRLSDLDTLTLDDVSKVYDSFIHANKHIFVCGNLDETIKKYLESIQSKNELSSNYSLIENASFNSKTISKDISQSSVAQIYATHTDINSKDYYPMLVMNSILGQSPTSLLFDQVREKHSLCYSIQSSLVRFDGAMLIYLGTKKENIEKALKLISKQIQRLIDLDFDEELLSISKKDCIDGLIVGQDQAFSIIEQSFLDTLLKRQSSIDEKIAAIENVTLEEISNVAKKLELVTQVIVEESLS